MKKVNNINEIGHKGLFIMQSNGQLKSLELKDITVTEKPIRWEDLPVGCKYYPKEYIDGNKSPHQEFKFGGKGLLVMKEIKFNKNTYGIRSLPLPIVSPLQREISCYQAKDRSPDVVAVKLEV